MTASNWNPFVLDLMASWPDRLDADMAAAYVAALQGRGVTDPEAALRALRTVVSEHPPSAPTLAALVLRDGQDDPPTFEETIAFVARTFSRRVPYGSDALSEYVAFVAEELHEAPARWIASIGLAALRTVPDDRHPLDPGQKARLRDFSNGYREMAAAWRVDPKRGYAVALAGERDRLAGREVPVLRAVPELEAGR